MRYETKTPRRTTVPLYSSSARVTSACLLRGERSVLLDLANGRRKAARSVAPATPGNVIGAGLGSRH